MFDFSPYDKKEKIYNHTYIHTFLFKDFIYFILREGKGGRKRGRETPMCGCLPCPGITLDWELNW